MRNIKLAVLLMLLAPIAFFFALLAAAFLVGDAHAQIAASGIVSYPDVTISETTPTIVCPADTQALRATVCNTNDTNAVSNTNARSGDINVSASEGDYTAWGDCVTYYTSGAIYGIATTSFTTTLSCTQILR